jgi:hypothetical protein
MRYSCQVLVPAFAILLRQTLRDQSFDSQFDSFQTIARFLGDGLWGEALFGPFENSHQFSLNDDVVFFLRLLLGLDLRSKGRVFFPEGASDGWLPIIHPFLELLECDCVLLCGLLIDRIHNAESELYLFVTQRLLLLLLLQEVRVLLYQFFHCL